MRDLKEYELDVVDVAWCPGCGDFQIMEALKKALAEQDLKPSDVLLASGIGQAAKLPHFMKAHFFNGLHGRSISNATGFRMANPTMPVLAIGGDGDMYGEGGNHFLHTIRRNPNITNLVHNNMVYGLTKGQASPTSPLGFQTPTTPEGVVNAPVNPIALAVSLGASFVARAFSGDVEQTKETIKAAMQHEGYALVDIFQPCVSFNKVNTFKWFKDHTYYLEESYDPWDRTAALEKAFEQERFALGILYRCERPVFEYQLAPYGERREALYKGRPDPGKVQRFIEETYV
ncbi:MAG: 2-oxoacid ferredoxin oxidoreductase [Synergistales bacterium]|nr:2-oxoacid ferredoxin oxidoreductase [Synergistales bacterium]